MGKKRGPNVDSKEGKSTDQRGVFDQMVTEQEALQLLIDGWAKQATVFQYMYDLYNW